MEHAPDRARTGHRRYDRAPGPYGSGDGGRFSRSEPKPYCGGVMSDGESKALPPHPEPAPKGLGFGARPLDLERAVSLFAARLRRNHAEEIRRDARKFKRRVVSILRRKMPPFAGRPTGKAITRAIELRKQCQTWQDIYPQCISDHAGLDPAERRQAESNLRAAIKSRRNSVQRRKRQRHFPNESRLPATYSTTASWSRLAAAPGSPPRATFRAAGCC